MNYNAPTLTGSPTLIISAANLTGSIANQSKTYGANDPLASGISVPLVGLINRTATVWYGTGSTIINDSALTSSIATISRAATENVGTYAITPLTFTAPSLNYNVPTLTGSPTLTISAANLTGSIADQFKTYGANDPLASGISVPLVGLINRTATVWYGTGSTIINDSALTSSIATISRAANENVGTYAITPLTFTAPSLNYNVPTLTGSPTLTISTANLTGSIADQFKTYGANDPLASGISVTLGGLINQAVNVWYSGSPVTIDDSGLASSSSIATISRAATENVGTYGITSLSFTVPSLNYNAPTLTGSPTLTISAANLTGSIANQSKIYGANDPLASGISVPLVGLINRTATVWYGTGSTIINDSALTSSIATISRAATENVGTYGITSLSFTVPSLNYNAPTLTGSPTLTISAANLTGSIADQFKTYGANDPLASGISVTLGGLINQAVNVWYSGSPVTIDDSGLASSSSIATISRAANENVGTYGITSLTFTAPSSNYNAPSLLGSPSLTIQPANLTGSIANQFKTYGANDPLASGISVTLGGLINQAVNVWYSGSPVTIDDSGLASSSSIATISRAANENVGTYGITSLTFTAPSLNYNAPTLTGSPTLMISAAKLTGSIANQFKTYGANDPLASGISVPLVGLINRTATVWYGTGSTIINDSALTSSIATISRAATENVGTYGNYIT